MNKLRNNKGITLTQLIIIVCIIIFITIFLPRILGHSIEEIAKETQRLIEDDWKEKGISVTILEDMSLTKKSGNEYSGMMKIMYEGKTIQLTGTVIYDGETIQWQPDQQNLLYQLLF